MSHKTVDISAFDRQRFRDEVNCHEWDMKRFKINLNEVACHDITARSVVRFVETFA